MCNMTPLRQNVSERNVLYFIISIIQFIILFLIFFLLSLHAPITCGTWHRSTETSPGQLLFNSLFSLNTLTRAMFHASRYFIPLTKVANKNFADFAIFCYFVREKRVRG